MHGQMDNELTKAQWIAALRQPEDQWAMIGDGQEWLGNMMEFHTPEIADDEFIRDIPGFLNLLDRWAEEFVAEWSHARHNRHYIHSEWLQGYPTESSRWHTTWRTPVRASAVPISASRSVRCGTWV